jgi:uncharacterized HAD superfamily protein
VVTGYAYLLFSVAPFENTPNADIGRHLLGYPIVFGLYLLSGWTRRRAYGRYASHVTAIVVFGIAFALLAWSYPVVARITDPPQAPGSLRARLNGGYLIAAFVTMLLYRVIRNRLSVRRKARKASGLRIGVDVDGVLANQIHGVLPRIRQRFGVALTYEEITDWRLPINGSGKTSGIDKEIEIAMHDPEYVLGMPTHTDARGVLEALAGDNTLIMITARPQEAEDWTRQWLNNNALPSDGILAVKEARKSSYGAEILIDDYIGNIKEYLSETSGVAILISQPWNQDRSEVQRWVEERRLSVVNPSGLAITTEIRPRLLKARPSEPSESAHPTAIATSR